MSKRKAIPERMKWQALIHRYLIQCDLCAEVLTPSDEIDWDHIHEVADGGPHDYTNIRPVHRNGCHKRKSAVAEAQRSRINRLEKELHGEPKRKRKSRKMPSRPFPKQSRSFTSRYGRS